MQQIENLTFGHLLGNCFNLLPGVLLPPLCPVAQGLTGPSNKDDFCKAKTILIRQLGLIGPGASLRETLL
jgi:hypothetical protein